MNRCDPSEEESGVPVDDAIDPPFDGDGAESEVPDEAAPQDGSDDPTDQSEENPAVDVGETAPRGDEWRLWPPSPKMQIALIAITLVLFNLLLIGIWAAVMVYRFN